MRLATSFGTLPWRATPFHFRYPPPLFPPSRPPYLRRQAHQDRLHIPAGLQTEQRAAVVDQVELNVPPTPHQLVFALRVGPTLQHPTPYNAREHLQERRSNITGECEIRIGV